jgi:hypothetical protein
MSISFWTAIVLIALGIAVWLRGDRFWLLAAGVGALLGAGLEIRIPSLAGSFVGWLIVVGLATLLGVLGFIFRRFDRIAALVVGFIAGGAIGLGFLDALGADFGLWDWVFALVVAVGAGLLLMRYREWGFIALGSLVGSLLIVRGLILWFLPGLVGPAGALVVLALTGLGVYYNYRQRKLAPASPPTSSS